MTTTDGRSRGTRGRALRLAVPVLGLAFAVYLLLASADLTGASGWYARVLVVLFGIVALVGTVIEVVRLISGRAGRAAEDSHESAGPESLPEVAGTGPLIRVAIVAASIVGMLLLADVIGFWLSMAVPVVAVLLVLGVRTWWKVVIAAALTVAGGYVIFTLLLQVRVPEGILGML